MLVIVMSAIYAMDYPTLTKKSRWFIASIALTMSAITAAMMKSSFDRIHPLLIYSFSPFTKEDIVI